MARSDAKIPDEYLGEINEENQKLLQLYYAYRKSQGKQSTYKPQLENFLGYKIIHQKHIRDIIRSDVKSFAEIIGQYFDVSNYNVHLSAIESFAAFLREKNKVEYNKDFLRGVSTQKNGFRKKEKKPHKSYKKALNPTQISLIRTYNEEGAVFDDYIFEIFFQLGIDEKQLEFCQPKHKNGQRHCFSYKGEEDIPYNNAISILLERIKEADEGELTKEIKNVQRGYFKKVSSGINEKVNATRLKESHAAYFLSCPNCKEKTENIQENWVLTKVESSDVYRLYCARCKGKSI